MSIEFTSDNGFTISVDEDDEDSGHELKWDCDPARFAANLRAAADWIDAHASKRLVVEVD